MSEEEHCSECDAELHLFASGLKVCPVCSLRLGESPATEATQFAKPDQATDPTDGPPRDMGRYRLLEAIGEGGMGTVYRAEQREPVRRQVAIKFVKWGMDTREVVARFEAERQALALMDHPAIARVFDGGATPEGRPYFVMEYVPGIPINDFCDTERLITRERLELFVQVCHGVQHAHQKGIIHRDLKPSNVLVSLLDNSAVPKVIDFGIAKAIGPRLSEDTLFTRLGQRIGTPEYMSPEQAEEGGLDVDTRTDVYSLGVMLYELLVGAQPIDTENLRRVGFDELLKRIRETDPPRPSTRIATLGDSSADSARKRRTEPSTLRRQLRGDLDWITMKALEKDRRRRYGSPDELAADVVRHLRDEPVLAGPPSTTYRVQKFIKRHRVAVAGASLVAIATLVAIGGTTVGLLRARSAERVAEAEAAKATAINDFLQEVLGSPDPYQRLGREVTVLEALEEAVGKIEGSFPDQPEIRAAVEDTIGLTYLKLGRYEEAEPLLRQGLELRTDTLSADHQDTAASLAHLGRLLRLTNDLDEAEELDRNALRMQRELAGAEHPKVADILYELAWVHTDRGEFDIAESLFREALEMRRKLLGNEHLDVAEAIAGLATAASNKGDNETAEGLYRKVLRMRLDLLGADNLLVAASQSSLALTLQSRGDSAAAEPLLRSALETRRHKLGDQHPDTANSLNSLGSVLLAGGDLEGAEAVFRELIPLYREVFGGEHPSLARSLHNLASVLASSGKHGEAEVLFRETLAMNQRTVGPDHVVVGLVLYNLARSLLALDEAAEAQSHAREASRILAAGLPADHWRVAVAMSVLGQSLTATGDFDEAEPLLVEAYPKIKEERGASSAAARDSLARIIALYRAWDKESKAKEYEALAELQPAR